MVCSCYRSVGGGRGGEGCWFVVSLTRDLNSDMRRHRYGSVFEALWGLGANYDMVSIYPLYICGAQSDSQSSAR